MVLQREAFRARVRDNVTAPITNIAPGDLEFDTFDRFRLSELS